MPKIFIFINGTAGNNVVGRALAEDGTGLASHISSSVGWARHDMGLTGNWKHEHYRAHYPDGFTLVDYTTANLDECADFLAAVEKNRERGGE